MPPVIHLALGWEINSINCSKLQKHGIIASPPSKGFIRGHEISWGPMRWIRSHSGKRGWWDLRKQDQEEHQGLKNKTLNGHTHLNQPIYERQGHQESFQLQNDCINKGHRKAETESEPSNGFCDSISHKNADQRRWRTVLRKCTYLDVICCIVGTNLVFKQAHHWLASLPGPGSISKIKDWQSVSPSKPVT